MLQPSVSSYHLEFHYLLVFVSLVCLDYTLTVVIACTGERKEVALSYSLYVSVRILLLFEGCFERFEASWKTSSVLPCGRCLRFLHQASRHGECV